ncbi:uncharacterized protein DMENIID0001_020500 [Sergentomyia squamirostris]
MEKNDFRVLIKHYFLRGKSPMETKEKLVKYYGENSPSTRMIYKWFSEFRCGRTDTKDAARPGRPIEVTTPEMIEKINQIVMNDKSVKVRQIAQKVGISSDRVHNILHEHLQFQRINGNWEPC